MDLTTNEVLQFDVHVPTGDYYFAYRIQARIRKLLHNKQVGQIIPYFVGQLGDLPSASGFFCVGSRYEYYRVV
jgi:hypothetical protein